MSFAKMLPSLVLLCLISITASAQDLSQWHRVKRLQTGTTVRVNLAYRIITGKIIKTTDESITLKVSEDGTDSTIEVSSKDIEYLYKRRHPVVPKLLLPIAATSIIISSIPVGFVAEGVACMSHHNNLVAGFLRHGRCGATHGMEFYPDSIQRLTQPDEWNLLYRQ